MYQGARLIESKLIAHFTNTLVQQTHIHSLKDKAMCGFPQGGCESHSHPVVVLASDRYVFPLSPEKQGQIGWQVEKKKREREC